MALEWGVTPLEIPETTDVEDLWTRSIDAARESGIVLPGERARDHRGHRGQHPRRDERHQGRRRVGVAPAWRGRTRPRAKSAPWRGRRSAGPTRKREAPHGRGRRGWLLPVRRARRRRVPLRPADHVLPRDAQPARRAPRRGRALRAERARVTARLARATSLDELARAARRHRLRPARRAPLHREGHRRSGGAAHAPADRRVPSRRWTIAPSSRGSSAASRARSGASSSAVPGGCPR